MAGAARFHASQGTTAMLPTLCPEDLSQLKNKLALLGRGYPQNNDDETPLPEILGLHLEGPFLNAKRRGAFDAGSLLLPGPGLVRELFEASEGTLRLMTLAPELDGGMALIREARECGIIPCLGHSDATYEQAVTAFHSGIRHATHLFNAMREFHHREPGCVLAALLDPEVSVEVVADGHHLHEAAVQMAYRLKGEDLMILITDAIPLSGRQSGSCTLGGQKVEILGKKALNQEGNLAGSLLTMADALRMAVHWAKIPLRDAVRMVTLNPARLLGLSDIRGRLFAGGEADLVILNGSLQVDAVYIGGSKAPGSEKVL
ncbi:MAG: N-acetylglucosamine-6-phosphate deacetylase [Desulfobacterales bacterium CG23_combo_of_CG06-09_8_20_14_all_52_9]|nr:MAG: N-acetylglucosamine-6-phosphate deacetylase [Desulfobacterales bacterium CG23_combo_of_CG06-09_8_20_14_all_52_9]